MPSWRANIPAWPLRSAREHDLTAEVASLEITHAPTPRSSQRRQFTDSGRFLQQSPLAHKLERELSRKITISQGYVHGAVIYG